MNTVINGLGKFTDNSYQDLRKIYPIVGDLIIEKQVYVDSLANLEYILEPELVKWTVAVIRGDNYELTRTEYNANTDVATWVLTRKPVIGDRIYKYGEFSHVLKVESDATWYAGVNTRNGVFKLNPIHRYKSGKTVWNLVYANRERLGVV